MSYIERPCLKKPQYSSDISMEVPEKTITKTFLKKLLYLPTFNATYKTIVTKAFGLGLQY
jgi:hypothetical protein